MSTKRRQAIYNTLNMLLFNLIGHTDERRIMSKKPFTNLAKYYDQIYSWINHKREAQIIKSLIKKHKKSAGNDLLDVACGTGNHITYLKDSFSIIGTDYSKTMLALARKKAPDVTFKQADMIHLNLNKKFDVIICMFDSIAYVKNYKNLNKVLANFARHLKKGGVVIIEPWLTEEKYTSIFMEGQPALETYDDNDLTIGRLCICKKRGLLSVMAFHHLIAEKNKVSYTVEHHEIAMFKVDKMLDIMNKNGIQAKFMKKGLPKCKEMGLYVGIKK